jgi:hypothetical protein
VNDSPAQAASFGDVRTSGESSMNWRASSVAASVARRSRSRTSSQGTGTRVAQSRGGSTSTRLVATIASRAWGSSIEKMPAVLPKKSTCVETWPGCGSTATNDDRSRCVGSSRGTRWIWLWQTGTDSE